MTIVGRTVRAVAVLAVVGAVSCGCSRGAGPMTSPATQVPTPTSSADLPSADSGGKTSAHVKNDLAGGSTQSVLRTGQVTINATYATSLPAKDWTPDAPKPVSVTLSATNNRHPDQRIYLSRVRLAVTASDSSGPIGDPLSLSDSANISPGYLINFPYTYSQVFTIPTVDDGARSVSLTYSYEVLSLVNDKDGKDYTKQTAVSTIQVPLR